MCVCVYVFHSWSSAGISVGSTPALQAYDVKFIESDSYSAIYTILNAGYYQCCGEFKTIIFVWKTNWPGSWFNNYNFINN